jgi:hypothetical protein
VSGGTHRLLYLLTKIVKLYTNLRGVLEKRKMHIPIWEELREERKRKMPEKTYEEWLEKVKKDGNALDYVPEEIKTEEMCLAAVRDLGNALCWVPEDLKTPEICLAAVQHNYDTF